MLNASPCAVAVDSPCISRHNAQKSAVDHIQNSQAGLKDLVSSAGNVGISELGEFFCE